MNKNEDEKYSKGKTMKINGKKSGKREGKGMNRVCVRLRMEMLPPLKA